MSDRCVFGWVRTIAVQKAEGVGFEPTDWRSQSTVFKTVPINHSGTPPKTMSRPRTVNEPRPLTRGCSLADLVYDVLGHVDRHIDGHCQRDRVAGPRIDLDELAVMTDSQFREIGVLAQLVDVNILQLAS